MNARTLHLAALTTKVLSAALAIVATTVFCYCLLNQSATQQDPAPVPLMPAPTADHPPAR